MDGFIKGCSGSSMNLHLIMVEGFVCLRAVLLGTNAPGKVFQGKKVLGDRSD